MFRNAIQEIQQFHVEPVLQRIDKSVIASSNASCNQQLSIKNNTEFNLYDLIKKYFGNNSQKS